MAGWTSPCGCLTAYPVLTPLPSQTCSLYFSVQYNSIFQAFSTKILVPSFIFVLSLTFHFWFVIKSWCLTSKYIQNLAPFSHPEAGFKAPLSLIFITIMSSSVLIPPFLSSYRLLKPTSIYVIPLIKASNGFLTHPEWKPKSTPPVKPCVFWHLITCLTSSPVLVFPVPSRSTSCPKASVRPLPLPLSLAQLPAPKAFSCPSLLHCSSSFLLSHLLSASATSTEAPECVPRT